ncbi:MAG: hypothetical protein LBG80_13010, partial [Bacteroidales bacterium]|nr:hypothetical protein [Bacteroidales bacterium]
NSDSARNDAIKNASNINEYEASIIHKVLTSKIESATDIEKSIFLSFIEWSATKTELHIETVAILERISASKIKASFIPKITEFAQKLNDKAKIVELYSKWQSENPKLKSAIENEMNDLKQT